MNEQLDFKKVADFFSPKDTLLTFTYEPLPVSQTSLKHERDNVMITVVPVI